MLNAPSNRLLLRLQSLQPCHDLAIGLVARELARKYPGKPSWTSGLTSATNRFAKNRIENKENAMDLLGENFQLQRIRRVP